MKSTESKLQFRSNCIIGYEEPVYSYHESAAFKLARLTNISKQRHKAYSGELTPNTKKRLTKAIDLLVQSAKPQWGYNEVTKQRCRHTLSFITLTISKHHNVTLSDAYESVFKHFLQWLRRTAKVSTYVWKAEIQQRGQIHYHITTPSFINCHTLRKAWNRLQQQAGYTNDYYSQHGHHDPNSTDIHEVRQVRDLSNYMKKEFCKSIQNFTKFVIKSDHTYRCSPTNVIESNHRTRHIAWLNYLKPGKVWDCSQNLKSNKYFSVYELNWQSDLIKSMTISGEVTTVQLEQCKVIKLKKFRPEFLLEGESLLQYHLMLDIIRLYRSES